MAHEQRAGDVACGRRRIVSGAVALGVLAGAAGGGIVYTLEGPAPASTSATSAGTCSVTKVASEDLPSVVTIMAKGASSSSTGSGEIVRSGAYILTNNHVVAPAANGGSLSVLFSDGRSARATLVGRDPLTDVAVIKVTGGPDVPPIPIGSSNSVRVGEPVIILGSPLGLSSTVTSGIVSALDRAVQVPGDTSPGAILIDAIQTDAAINPGNSGGAMVNCAGQLIGMPSAGATVPSASGESSGGSIGLGFAIPVDLATSEAEEIIRTGRVVHAYLGLDAEPLSAGEGRSSEGLLVTAVDTGGPAQAAGLRVGDVITAIDGKAAKATDQLVALSLTKRPGSSIELSYRRAGRTSSVRITLAPQP